jgi:RNA polymerase-binding transcription factor DksA
MLVSISKRQEEIMAADLQKVRSNLTSVKKRLLDELEQLNAAGRPSEERREGSPFGKREEEATESLELERRLAMEKNIKEQLADVDNALGKFTAGTYGACESCGKPIEPARLEALPHARLCLNCKALQSKNAKNR